MDAPIKYGTLLETLYFTLSITAPMTTLGSVYNHIVDDIRNSIYDCVRASDTCFIKSSLAIPVLRSINNSVEHFVKYKTHEHFK